jgi:hypothetical protein
VHAGARRPVDELDDADRDLERSGRSVVVHVSKAGRIDILPVAAVRASLKRELALDVRLAPGCVVEVDIGLAGVGGDQFYSDGATTVGRDCDLEILRDALRRR